jgi:hypothetical protein
MTSFFTKFMNILKSAVQFPCNKIRLLYDFYFIESIMEYILIIHIFGSIDVIIFFYKLGQSWSNLT